MKHISKYTFILIFIIPFLWSCKTNKNTFIHRGYHNLTARFNGYYYATESIKEGEFNIRTAYKYDYDRLLPVFLVPDNATAKTTFPDFDKAIKKSSNCIQRHTIKDKKGNEIPTAGKWIDNNWNVIGISQFYKREFFSGIESFEYVIRTYKSKDKYKAMVWLARSYNEIGAPSQAEPIIGLLKDDKNISKYAKKELPAVQAQYFIQRGMFEEAKQSLLKAIKNKPKKSDKARYSFILAQLYEERKENKNAIAYYQKTISAKPDYELIFNARMKQARLYEANSANIKKVKKDLMAMTYDIKNKEYLDVIYYTLGEIYEKEKDEKQAIANYKLSISNSTQNPKQKALSYLKLGEINFEQTNYTASGAYYDSCMITLPKDYKDYDAINRRKTTLETLVGYIKTIQREDSLQRIAKMSEADRDKFIAKMMAKIEADEEKKKEELEALKNNTPTTNAVPNNGMPNLGGGAKGDWYFYNPNLVAFGVNDFIKKFGNRKLEDNWRRSQKGASFDGGVISNDPNEKEADAAVKKNKTSNAKSKEFYLADLPLDDSLIKKSNVKIIDAYYNLASTYKEELNNNKKAIATYEELNKRYETNKYKVATYYQLYRIYVSTRNQSQADYYKNKLINEFPESEYAQILKNPNYQAEKNSQKGEVELFYTETYNQYATSNYSSAYNRCVESESKFGKNDFSGRFAFIKAMCLGKTKGMDTLEIALKKMQVLYPKEPVTKQAQDILEVLYNIKHPNDGASSNTQKTDTFTLDMNAPHFVIAVCPDDPAIANTFKSSLADFNTNFYSTANLSVTSSLFGSAEQISICKTFKNAEDAKEYLMNLSKDKAVFTAKVKRELFTLMVISADNLPKLYKKKQLGYYKPFYDDHYKFSE